MYIDIWPRYVADRARTMGSTIHSPQILELSGIGRPTVLEEISVPTKLDLPGVGENLQEHVVLCVAFGEPRGGGGL